jgi:hypothetical protein
MLLPANGAGSLLPFVVSVTYLTMALVFLKAKNFRAGVHATN